MKQLKICWRGNLEHREGRLLEEIDSFRPVRSGNTKDLEKLADLLDVAIVNLKEANQLDELKDGLLYMKLQKKLPTSMLIHYHRWIYENHKIESVEVLQEWVLQETEFQIKALETVQGLSGKWESKIEGKKWSHTYFGKSDLYSKTETYSGNRSCKLCSKQHGIWACDEFKELELPKRWDCANRFKLCFCCLGNGHLGQQCPPNKSLWSKWV